MLSAGGRLQLHLVARIRGVRISIGLVLTAWSPLYKVSVVLLLTGGSHVTLGQPPGGKTTNLIR